MNINFNSYESNLSTKEFKNFEDFHESNMMGFSPDSENLIVFSDERITLLSLENKDNWKVCSQLFIPKKIYVSKDEENYNHLYCNSFNITDNNITIATLSFNTKRKSITSYQIKLYNAK